MANNVNTKVFDAKVDRAAQVRKYGNGVNKSIVSQIVEHASRVIGIVRGSDGKKRSDALDKEVHNTYATIANKHKRDLVDFAGNQSQHTASILSKSAGDIFRVKTPARAVAEEFVLNQPLYNNKVLSAGWADIALSERKRIEKTLREGIAQGQTAEQLAELLKTRKVFNTSRNHSVAFATTAMTSVYAQADHAVYKANAQLLRGYQYVAILDSHTTTICAGLDGKVFPIEDTTHLPPQHWNCRSTTTPVVKDWNSLLNSESLGQIRKRNLKDLSAADKEFYDGLVPDHETYSQWLLRQPQEVQIQHLGDVRRMEAFQQGLISLSDITDGDSVISLKELRQVTNTPLGVDGDTRRFVFAKMKLDTIQLGAVRPEDLYEMESALVDYYKLQAGELDGVLSYTNFRGNLIGTKKAARQRVLTTMPREEQLKFNPITGRYEDTRMFQPNPAVLRNNMRLVEESDALKPKDKQLISNIITSLEDSMSVNERAVVADNLRITIGRYRKNPKEWGNFKAVLNSQIKFDVMNVSDFIETQLRRDADIMKRLANNGFVDPVLGDVSLDELSERFIENIHAANVWDWYEAPKLAKPYVKIMQDAVPTDLYRRLDDNDFKDCAQAFIKQLATADTPDRDQLAMQIGRKMYNTAAYRGSRSDWFNLGKTILDAAEQRGDIALETFGVQKRRMKSRNGGRYFGPYYDTFAVNVRTLDPGITEYKRLRRAIDVGMRVPALDAKRRLYVKEGELTYFDYWGRDTYIPITSADSVSFFPPSMIDADMTKALNQAGNTRFKVDSDMLNFVDKLLAFTDDRGKAKYYDELNEYRAYMTGRGDAYERIKTMRWLRDKDAGFSNNAFLDHRARIYERGFIGPQSGETFRPFLSTEKKVKYSKDEFYNFRDQIGSFLGGASDVLEGKFNALTVIGRQSVAKEHHNEMVRLGYAMRSAKPADIRSVLESPLMHAIEGEEQGKLMRFAIELSKMDEFLGGDFSAKSLEKLSKYEIALALEQDASSSGAQIIALTTRNKQLASMSNVVPTNQKRRLYDEIAAATFDDPRFKRLNERLGLTEKDLRKAAKAQNMVNKVAMYKLREFSELPPGQR